MFGGIGSLGDLNSTFASFTNALSLDNLQGNENPDLAKPATAEEVKTESSLPLPEAAAPKASKGHSRIFYEQRIVELQNILDTQQQENQILKERYKELEEEIYHKNKSPPSRDDDRTFEIESLKQIIEALREENTSIKQEKQQLTQKNRQLIEEKKALEAKFTELTLTPVKPPKSQLQSEIGINTDDETPPSPMPFVSSPSLVTPVKGAEIIPSNDLDVSILQQLQQSQDENKRLLRRINKWKNIEKEMQEKIQQLQQSQEHLQFQLNKQNEQHEQVLAQSNNESERVYEELKESYEEKVRNLSQKEEELKQKEDLYLRQIKQMDSRLQELESDRSESEKLESLMKQYQELQSEYQHFQHEHHSALEAKDSLYQEFQHSSRQEIQKVEDELEELRSGYAKLQAELNEVSESKAQIEAQEEEGKQFYESEITKKEEVIKNLESKVTGITEKLKELMQKYADLKNKNIQLEKNIEGISMEREKGLQQKESDIVKIQLKMERVEQLNADLKSELQTLSDRYSENQRLLQDLKHQYQDFQAKHEQCDELHHAVQVLHREKDDIVTSYERKLLIVQKDSQESIDKLTNQLHSIQYAYEILEKKYSDDTENKQILDNYKKKAQLALKSSNETISKLTVEKETFEQRNQQLEQDNEDQRKEIDLLRTEYNELKQILEDERTLLHEKEKQLKDINQKYEQLQSMRSSHNSSFPPRPISNKKNLAMEKLNLLREHSDTSLVPFDEYLDENGGVVIADSDDSGAGSRTDQGENRSNTDSFTEISYPNVSEVQSQAHHSVSPIQPRTSSLGNTPVLDSTDDLFHFNEKYLLVKQLQEQILEMKNNLARSNSVIEELSHNLKIEKNEKNELKGKYEDLLAYINRINRYQSTPATPSNNAGMSPAMSISNISGVMDSSTGVGKTGSHDGSEKSTSANLQERTINYEYLKNCIYKYMTSNNLSEKQRLYPVIGMILQFSSKELKQIEALIQEEIQNDPTDQIQSAISTISSSLDYWFSSGATNPPHPNPTSQNPSHRK